MTQGKNTVRLLIGAISLIAASCSSSKIDSGSTTSGITISGTLNLNSSSAYSKMGGDTFEKADFQSFAATEYKVQCTSIDDASSKVTAAVNSDGTFSVSGVAKNSVGSQILDGTDTALAAIVFEDSSSKDMKVNLKLNHAYNSKKTRALAPLHSIPKAKPQASPCHPS